MKTFIALDLTKDILPAEVIVKLHGENETYKQKQKRIEKEEKQKEQEKILNWEKEIRIKINTDLIEKRKTYIRIDKMYDFDRNIICDICDKISKEYSEKGYFISGWGRYSLNNFYQWYELIIFA